ncbi:MAG: ATP-binding protein [Candidatus Eremiobacteraeota bacterium]|nr:ATP-binding protein [Candidatus Eremiobacteraeota bacterium]MBV8721977.1 ATP-binding protein [Candidatus Eremiobacteraeota bacterium]
MSTKLSNGKGTAALASFSLQLMIPPLPRYVRSARGALRAFGSYHHVADRDLENLTFALGEALANAIEHAETQSDIAVGFRVDDGSIVATVSDRGRGLDEAPQKTAPLPPDFTETGRGFAIIARCTDFYDVRTVPGEGTVVTMGRYRSR